MNGERVVAAALALLCVAAFGTAATTLDSTVSDSPGDVVNPDYGSLPFEQEDVAELREELQAIKERSGEAQTSKPADSGPTEPQSDSGATEPQSEPRPGDGEEQTAPASDSQGPARSGASERPDASKQGPAEPSFLDRLLALLASLWPLLALLLVGALVYRYRRRIRALLTALAGEARTPAAVGADVDPWTAVDASNDVERAWIVMVRAAGLSNPRTKTPGECADEAVSSGLDPEAVRGITDAYRAVRYGGASAAGRHERRAQEALRRLDRGRVPR